MIGLVLTQDAFVHLPHLRGKIIPIEQSAMRFTREALAVRDERAREAGYPADWRQSDEQIEKSWKAFLENRSDGGDLWVFAYGSLMWDPGFHYEEVRLADVDGYQRRFTVKIEVITGSPERPGLALSLEPQPGRCSGLVFRIAADAVQAETEIIWRREMILFSYSPTMMSVMTPQGEVSAVIFASDRTQSKYIGEKTLSETATIIARGARSRGVNRTYLDKLADELILLGVNDEYIASLSRDASNINI